MFSLEETLTGNIRNLIDSRYKAECDKLSAWLNLGLTTELIAVRQLASWGLAENFASVKFPDKGLCQALKILELLEGNNPLPHSCDGMLAKAIQSLRLHNKLSYKNFINPI